MTNPLLHRLSEILGYEVLPAPQRRTRRQVLEAQLATLERRQRERVRRGRTRGAGAGGYCRDLDNITHQIRLVKAELADLPAEPVGQSVVRPGRANVWGDRDSGNFRQKMA